MSGGCAPKPRSGRFRWSQPTAGQMMEKFDVIVIGAGLFGTFTAFFLRRRGLNVAVVDRGFVGAQSSGANFGNLRLQGRAALQYP
ncbi:FAD-dependent oxidoreductase, partial [Mesorhizobium sp. M7A.F.Ca.ET.027.03.2.1]|uniref:FAD-dependent oxidoreductase n=1 Tax=Mesorhizobium sp. M7A.F.Ca.ET.027.03.2.1 TaxID=2496656 RepID=UPI0032AFF145